MIDNDRMTVAECAEYIGVSRSTLYAMVRRKEIPHWRVRTQIRFSKATLDKWKDEQQRQSIV